MRLEQNNEYKTINGAILVIRLMHIDSIVEISFTIGTFSIPSHSFRVCFQPLPLRTTGTKASAKVTLFPCIF